MIKPFIIIAVIVSSFSFCTNENPVATSPTGNYTDSIVVDLYSYFVWCIQHNSGYYGPVEITPKGEEFLKAPLDPNLKTYNTGAFTYPLFAPKYTPSQFAAYAYDSIPLAETDSTAPGILVKSYSNSRHYFFCLDTTTQTDSVKNPQKGIKQISSPYIYGAGFYLEDYTKWGIGKIVIYYK